MRCEAVVPCRKGATSPRRESARRLGVLEDDVGLLEADRLKYGYERAWARFIRCGILRDALRARGRAVHEAAPWRVSERYSLRRALCGHVSIVRRYEQALQMKRDVHTGTVFHGEEHEETLRQPQPRAYPFIPRALEDAGYRCAKQYWWRDAFSASLIFSRSMWQTYARRLARTPPPRSTTSGGP